MLKEYQCELSVTIYNWQVNENHVYSPLIHQYIYNDILDHGAHVDELEHVEEHAGDVEEEKEPNNDDQDERQVYVTLHLLLSDEQIYFEKS